MPAEYVLGPLQPLEADEWHNGEVRMAILPNCSGQSERFRSRGHLSDGISASPIM